MLYDCNQSMSATLYHTYFCGTVVIFFSYLSFIFIKDILQNIHQPIYPSPSFPPSHRQSLSPFLSDLLAVSLLSIYKMFVLLLHVVILEKDNIALFYYPYLFTNPSLHCCPPSGNVP